MGPKRPRPVDPLIIGAIAVPVVALLVLAVDGYLVATKPNALASLEHNPFPWMLVAVPIVLVLGFVIGSRTSPIVPLLIILVAIAEERFQQPLLPQGGVNLRLDELLAPSITLGFVTREWIAGRLWRDLTRIPGLVILGLFLLANLVPTVLIMSDHARGASLYIILLGGAVCYVGVALLAARVGSVREVLGALVVIGVLEAVIGLVTLGLSVWQGQPVAFGVQVDSVTHIIEPYGTMYEANFFGQYLVAILLIAIVFLVDRLARGFLRSWLTLALTLVAVVAAGGVFASETRAAWLGLAIGLMLLALLWPLRRTQAVTQRTTMHRVIRWLPAVVLPLVLVGSAAAIILIGGPNNPLARRMSSVFNFTTGSGYGRIRILRLVLGDLSDPILGMGDGSFNIALPAGLNQTPDGHPWIYSMFLAVLHDSGIIGLALWFIFLGVIYVQLIRVIRSDLWPGLQTYAIAVGVVLTSLLVSAQATTSMYLIFFWAFLGLAGAVPGLAARDRARLAAREEATDAIDGADAGRQEAEMDVALLDRGGIRRTEPSQSDIHP